MQCIACIVDRAAIVDERKKPAQRDAMTIVDGKALCEPHLHTYWPATKERS